MTSTVKYPSNSNLATALHSPIIEAGAITRLAPTVLKALKAALSTIRQERELTRGEPELAALKRRSSRHASIQNGINISIEHK